MFYFSTYNIIGFEGTRPLWTVLKAPVLGEIEEVWRTGAVIVVELARLWGVPFHDHCAF
jgi:hypothetical protein